MHNENWDDLRYILAVAETGSVLQAAKRLSVNHATVLRHVAAFEARHDTVLFERTARGYRLLSDRADVIRAVQEAGDAMREVDRIASGGRMAITGTVRITSTDTFCAMVLPNFAVELASEDQDFDITLLNSNAHLDLIREQAHIIVRPAIKLAEDLVGTAVCELGFAAYATREDATEWHRLTGPLSRSVAGKWMAEKIPQDRLTHACDSFLTLCELAAISGGIAILPRFVGDSDRRLIRLSGAMPPMNVPIWVGHHIDTIVSQQLKTVQNRLETYLSKRQTFLLGDPATL